MCSEGSEGTGWDGMIGRRKGEFCGEGSVRRGARATLAIMKEYQAVIVRLTRHVRDDEDALTDLLNERSRMGWTPTMLTQDALRLTVIFERDTPHTD